MANTYTAVIRRDDDWWIGWVEEVPGVTCQERTREELIETIRVTLHEAIEMNRADAIEAMGANYEEVAVEPAEAVVVV